MKEALQKQYDDITSIYEKMFKQPHELSKNGDLWEINDFLEKHSTHIK